MIFKRFAGLLLILIMLCPWAALAADGTFATFRLPEGAETALVTDIRTMDIPEGAEAMYSAMGRASMGGDTYIVRMKNGLALASVSWSPLRRQISLEELVAMGPQLSAALYRDFAYVDVENIQITDGYFGRETVTLRALAGETEAQYQLVGAAFPENGVMYEVWTIAPADGQLDGVESDMRDMEYFIQSLAFGGGQETARLMDDQLAAVELPANQLYTDEANRFCAGLPMDSLILTPQSAPEARQEARQAYLSANGQGADRVFDGLMEDIDTEGATVVFCDGFQAAAAFFCESVPEMAGMTTADFLSMGEGIAQSLMEEYDLALCLSANEAITLSGMEHCLLRMGVRSDALSQYLTLAACIDEQGLLREIDLFTPARQGQDGANALLALLLQTLQYQ